MTYIDYKFMIGNIGEKAIERLIKTKRTDDWYDSEKDGNIGNMKYEVKTIRLNFKTKSFWLGENKTKTMWKKVDGVDMLFFVKVPETEDELASIYYCVDHRNCWFKESRNDGEEVRAYPITNCWRLPFTLGKSESNTIFQYSKKISTHGRNRNNVG